MPIGDKSLINFRRKSDRRIKLDFIAESHGIGSIDLYYAGNYVKTINIDLTSDMEVK